MSMYIEHFGMREAPFRITPHTEFFFSGGNRGATLEALMYAITHDEGIVKVTGEVGSGKTMLCRMLLERLPRTVRTIYLANPSMTRDEILFALAGEIDLAEPPSRVHLLLRTIQHRLVELYGEGKQVVMLIDEAHAMPAESLEEIRLLSNLESNRHKLLQIVLFGQPELDELLARNEMRQLRERVTHNFALEPLHRQDIGSYINFRMRAAGFHGPDPFTASAIQLISASSVGLTRRINILADKALLAAYSENLYQVDAPQAKAAIRDAQFGPMPGQKPASRNARGLATGLALGLGVAALAAMIWFKSTQSPTAASPAATTSAPTGAAQAAAAGAGPAPTPHAAPPAPGAPAPGAAMAAGAPPAPAASATAAAEAPAKNRLRAFGDWMNQANDRHYFIQLMRTRGDGMPKIEDFIERHGKALDDNQLRVYRSTINGQEWLGLIYGEYASRDEAAEAIRNLPAAARANGPYPRLVRNLR